MHFIVQVSGWWLNWDDIAPPLPLHPMDGEGITYDDELVLDGMRGVGG